LPQDFAFLMPCAGVPTTASRSSGVRSALELGVEFRRQVVIANQFIVDFLAPRIKLVMEVDGRACHERRPCADARRDRKLARLGYRVLRIDADLVERDFPAAALLISAALVPSP
jgi:very-short-patch-repair endonuclease